VDNFKLSVPSSARSSSAARIAGGQHSREWRGAAAPECPGRRGLHAAAISHNGRSRLQRTHQCNKSGTALTLVAFNNVTNVPLRLSLIKPERLDPAVQQQLVEKTLRKRRAKEEMTESYYFM